ncbi:glycoside hydrolase family 3 protein [Glonium stellatum]|uniref:Probable beta-glucosidase G n=1 Tax=Glonium stellatum TaxID=574774 RepID=A0A8E2F8D6_9PEZI|nr:glycoside hydrolase family 3 protein [Glonium stellatum]
MVTGTTGPCAGNIPPISRLGFNGLCLQDGPLAIRQAVYASVFPAGLSIGASWDRGLMYQRGLFMGQEFKGKGAHVALGPVAGPLGRSPYGGRNWEGFSPDPYLSGVALEETITGMQTAGIQACTKHYIGNEQETQRNPSTATNGETIEAVSSNIDDRTMHEMYLWPFANAVHAGTASIMCSYNRLNGSYGCQNSKSLNGLLKEELGFQGYVMSDWSATHSGVPAIEAGLDMNMPGGISFLSPTPSFFGANITTAVNNGSLPISRLDDMIRRIMTPYFYLGQNSGYPAVDGSGVPLNFFAKSTWVDQFTLGPTQDVRDNHASLIRELGSAGTVLLKNINNTLPLKMPKNIGVLGNDAADFSAGMYSLNLLAGIVAGNYDIGTLPTGGGSGTGRFSYVVSPLEAIKSRANTYGALVQYITNNTIVASAGGLGSLAPSPLDVCLVFLKSWSTEGEDRISLVAEWNSTAVVENVATTCNNTIVVLHGAAPNVLPFAANPNVTAILVAHMPGQETGNSIVDVLWGDVNPSGHLPYTIANSESDYERNIVNSTALLTTTDPNAWQADYSEGQMTDYRYFDSKNESVLYEFGFGLSYTSFALSGLEINKLSRGTTALTPSPNAPILPGGNSELWDTLFRVSVTVTNTGEVAGAAVPQLYLSFGLEAGEGIPVRVLRGFEKVSLQPGQSSVVNFALMRRDVSYWNTMTQQWTIPKAGVKVAVGFSSRDLPLSGSLSV